jgi:hypothetical protein
MTRGVRVSSNSAEKSARLSSSHTLLVDLGAGYGAHPLLHSTTDRELLGEWIKLNAFFNLLSES